MAFLRNTLTVGGLTLGSRVLGFIRDILIAAGLGAGLAADAFFVAFKLPNLFRRLFAEGAFSAAFVPVLSEELEKRGRAAAAVFASQAMTALLWILLAFVLIMEAMMPWALHVLAPGFADDPVKFALTLDLTRITFPYLLFVALVALLGGVLNTLNRFAAMAASPVLLNLCMIAALWSALTLWPAGLAVSGQPEAARRLAWAVFAAGVVQLIWMQAASRRAGIRPGIWSWSWSPQLKEMLRRLLPVALGAGVYQINLVIDIILASLLVQGSVSFLYYADRVNQLPLGVIGIAVGTTLLPLLSRHIAAGRDAEAANAQNRAIEFALLLTIPAAVGLLTLAGPIIIVLFERGAFTAVESQATAAALAAFSLGLPAYVLVKVLAPAFFARGDTATPVRIAVIALVVNLVLNLILMGPLAHVGLALASSAAAWVNAGCLAVVLRRRGYFTVDGRLLKYGGLVLSSAAGMAGVLLLGLDWAGGFLGGSEMERTLALAALIAGGGLFYGAAARVLGLASRRFEPHPGGLSS